MGDGRTGSGWAKRIDWGGRSDWVGDEASCLAALIAENFSNRMRKVGICAAEDGREQLGGLSASREREHGLCAGRAICGSGEA